MIDVRTVQVWGHGLMAVAAILSAPRAFAQVTLDRGPLTLAVEGYANLTSGSADLNSHTDVLDDAQVRVDAAVRALARWTNPAGPDVGVRIVVETSPEHGLNLAEASFLVFGRGGRFEIGERQGLPDVLLGYAPNNFTFTGAEFGPASGPSLDPGGGLQNAFLDSTLASQLRELSVLGFAASLSDDRSAKALYVSPKWHGWLGGLSYAAQATDPRFKDLIQAGLTHDTYWGENVLHIGGSYSFARASQNDLARRNLHSVNAGATLVLHYDWMLGASVTYNGRSGNAVNPTSPRVSDAWGAVVSLNYNYGAWTVGGFVQRGTAEGDIERGGDDHLTAYEAGLSYRATTKLRAFVAWYYFDFDDEGGSTAADRHQGQLLFVGLRATL